MIKQTNAMQIALAAVLLVSTIHGKELNFVLEHSLDGISYSKAGSIQGEIFETDLTRGEQLTLIRSDLTAQEQKSLVELAKSNEFYKLRIPSDPQREDSPKIMTSIPARCLISSGLQDHIQLHAAANGRFIGINYDFSRHPCSPEAELKLAGELNFPESSTVDVWTPVTAPVLKKGSTYVESGKGKPAKTAKQRAASGGTTGPDGEDAPVEDNRPWILKNWMIALPLAFVALNLASAIMGPVEGGGAATAAPPSGGRRR